MPREAEEDLEKVTINLVQGDKEVLADFYPAMGWSVAARKIINNTCKRLREIDSQEVKIDESKLDIAVPIEELVPE